MSRKTITLNNVKEIAEWCKEKGRTPRAIIKGIKVSKDREAETEEQKELRLGQALNHINNSYLKKYEGVELKDIENEIDREIVRLIKELKERYSAQNTKKTITLNNVKEIAEWCEEKGRTPRERIKGIKVSKDREAETEEQKELRLGEALNHINNSYLKKYEGVELKDIENETEREVVRLIKELKERYSAQSTKKTITLNNVKEIAEWCKEKGRTPRERIKGIKVSKDREAETEEQKELRLGEALNHINNSYLKKYEGVELKDIENEIDREIVRLIKELKERYSAQNTKNKYKGTKMLTLNNVKEIAEWYEEKGRTPRERIKGIKVSKDREAETEEQKELRLGEALNYINNRYLKRYEGVELKDIENEIDREIVRLIKELKERYSAQNTKNRYKGKKMLTLNNVKEIAEWCEEKGRTPRARIKGIKVSKDREAETEEQKELRLGEALNYINNRYLKRYEGVELKDIEDETEREIVRLIREVIEGYSKKYIREKKRERKPNNVNQTYLKKYEGVELKDIEDEIDRESVRIARAAEAYRKSKPQISSKIEKFDKIKLAQMIVGLIKSRHATMEQIQVIADYYDVDLEDTLGSLETHNTLELR